MGNSESYISTTDSSSSGVSTSSTIERIRHMSYDSDVFYPDSSHLPGMQFEKPGLPDLTPENFPTWRTEDINPMLLKYMKRSYKPCPETFKASAKKLAELAAAQKIPKFVSTFGGSQCIKLHWACLAGWCMCRYQYQPLTPLHLMPHTRLTSSNVIRKPSMPSISQDEESVTSSDDVTLDTVSSDKIELYDDTIEHLDDRCDVVNSDAMLHVMKKETTV